MGIVFYQNCSTDADFGIFSVVASQCCFMLYIFRAELSVAVEIMVAVRRKATISQRKNLMKYQSQMSNSLASQHFIIWYYFPLISIFSRLSFLNYFDFPYSLFNFQFQMFLAMSAAGTKFHGYFFAFHLLNIVNNNQLLSGVIKAVTLNGNL